MEDDIWTKDPAHEAGYYRYPRGDDREGIIQLRADEAIPCVTGEKVPRPRSVHPIPSAARLAAIEDMAKALEAIECIFIPACANTISQVIPCSSCKAKSALAAWKAAP